MLPLRTCSFKNISNYRAKFSPAFLGIRRRFLYVLSKTIQLFLFTLPAALELARIRYSKMNSFPRELSGRSLMLFVGASKFHSIFCQFWRIAANFFENRLFLFILEYGILIFE